MPDQLQFEGLGDLDPPSGLPARAVDSLRLRGEHLISDNWDIMLVPSVRGKTRYEGRWIVCHREHLESYVSAVETHVLALQAQIRELESRL